MFVLMALPRVSATLSLVSFSQAGDVVYTDVDKQGGGIVEFANKADQVLHGLYCFMRLPLESVLLRNPVRDVQNSLLLLLRERQSLVRELHESCT